MRYLIQQIYFQYSFVWSWLLIDFNLSCHDLQNVLYVCKMFSVGREKSYALRNVTTWISSLVSAVTPRGIVCVWGEEAVVIHESLWILESLVHRFLDYRYLAEAELQRTDEIVSVVQPFLLQSPFCLNFWFHCWTGEWDPEPDGSLRFLFTVWWPWSPG